MAAPGKKAEAADGGAGRQSTNGGEDSQSAEPGSGSQSTDLESPRIDECYICCGEGSADNELVRNVCACRTTAMHLRCQRQMLEASLIQSIANGVSCRVCHSRYQNAELRVSWCLSWMGIMWVTLPLALGLMLWSAILVISDGGTREVDLLSLRCWADILEHLTWWRIVGLVYLTVFALGTLWVVSLLLSVCASAEGRRSGRQLLQATYTVHVSRNRIAPKDPWRGFGDIRLHLY